jgi:uncharacterized membrane protein YdbT with pleckstrin-like domain
MKHVIRERDREREREREKRKEKREKEKREKDKEKEKKRGGTRERERERKREREDEEEEVFFNKGLISDLILFGKVWTLNLSIAFVKSFSFFSWLQDQLCEKVLQL